MGYNTAVLILNDAMGNLKTDPDVGRKLYDAMGESSRPEYREKGVDFSIGNHGNGGMVLPSYHADTTQIIAVGGNYMRRLGVTFGSLTDDERLLKNLAESLGYTVTKARRL